MKKFISVVSGIALASGMWVNAEVMPSYADRIFLRDGTEICGYVEREDLGEDAVDLHVLYMTFNVPDTLVTVEENEVRVSQMPPRQRALLLDCGYTEQDYLDLWDIRTRHGQKYPRTSVPGLSRRLDEGMQLVVREDGTTMRTTDYTERTERVLWDEIKTIQKPEGGTDHGVIEILHVVDANGAVREYEGNTLSNNIGVFRRFIDRNGRIYNFDNSRILVVERLARDSGTNLLEIVPMLDVVYLEADAGTPLTGVIETENKDEQWIDFIDGSTGEKTRITYEDIAALGYRPNERALSGTSAVPQKKRRSR